VCSSDLAYFDASDLGDTTPVERAAAYGEEVAEPQQLKLRPRGDFVQDHWREILAIWSVHLNPEGQLFLLPICESVEEFTEQDTFIRDPEGGSYKEELIWTPDDAALLTQRILEFGYLQSCQLEIVYYAQELHGEKILKRRIYRAWVGPVTYDNVLNALTIFGERGYSSGIVLGYEIQFVDSIEVFGL
jgi:hypothetical protein